MGNDFVFASKVVDLSEEKDYLTLRNRVFYFNSPNLNHVQIDFDDSSLEQCKTLINCPLLAHYVKRNGQDDLGGHEVSVENGQTVFNTAAIGTITDVEIVEEDVATVDGKIQKLPCLYATEIVWTRFKNATNAIRRLYENGKLHNSWELKSGEYSYSSGIKTIKSYTFIGNCLLGTESYPAYGLSASVLNMAESNGEYEYLAAEDFSEALALDIESAAASNIDQLEDTNRKEGLSMDANEVVVVETSEEETKEETVEVTAENNNTEETVAVEADEVVDNEVAEASEDNPVEESANEPEQVESSESEDNNDAEETSAMKTTEDIYRMIRDALNDSGREDFKGYMEVSMVFPEEKIVLVRDYNMRSLEFVKYNYRIDGDKVVLENEEKVELNVSPLQINSEIEKKNNAIVEANNRIVELENQNAELIKAKEELDKIRADKADAEHAEAVNKLREYVVNSGRFTKEEIESEAIQNAINGLNEAWIKAEIADRFIAELAANKPEVETSGINKSSVEIVLSGEEKAATPEEVMRAFFNN